MPRKTRDYLNYDNITGRDRYLQVLRKELGNHIDKKTGLLSERFSHNVNCPICELNDYKILFNEKGYTYVKCNKCDMVYVNPQVNTDIIDSIYNKAESINIWMDVLTSPIEQDFNLAFYGDCIKKLEELTMIDERYLIDIGCSTGDLMVAAENIGWRTLGLELNNRAAEYAKSERGLNVIEKKLEHLEFEDGSIPLFTAMGLLEHLPNPKDFLLVIHRLLKEKGIIIVLVPNLYGLYNMILKENSMSFDGRNHLAMFSVDTLKNLFEKTGFEVIHYFTAISGLHTIIKFLCYADPYSSDFSTDNIPLKLQPFFKDKGHINNLEDLIIKYDLGHRIIMYAQKV